jgi:Trypsin-like peptidase domain
MNKSARVLFFSLALPLLTQCLESEDSKYVSTFEFNDKKHAEQVVSNISVSCENLNHCQESSGGLLFVETQQAFYGNYYTGGVCSQTLIGPNRILTNRHCLPGNALSKGASCDNITVFFPATRNKHPEKIKCKSVVDLSAKYTASEAHHPDWAILELVSSSNRTPVPVDASGIPHDSETTAYPVYYQRSDIQSGTSSTLFTITGKIKKRTCTSKMNTALSQYYIHPENPIFISVCDGEIVHGNSGSGLYGKNGLLGAISMAVDNNAGVETFGKKVLLQNHVAGGSNAHCMSSFNQQPRESCEFNDKDNVRLVVGGMMSFLLAQDASDSEKQKYESMLNDEQKVQWEEHNVEFSTTIYNPEATGEFADILTGTVTESILSRERQFRLPKTPRCIHEDQKAAGDFTFFLPTYYSKYSDVEMQKSALYKSPLNAVRLAFTARYDATQNVFKARLLRVNQKSRMDFNTLMDKISDELWKCYPSQFSFDCNELKKAEAEQAELFESANSDLGARYFNEYFIDGNRAGANEINIPVCED